MKKILSILLAALLLLSLAACAAPQEKPDTQTQETTTAPAQTTGETQAQATGETETTAAKEDGEMVAINVTVVHSDGTEKKFSYETNEEFLGALLQKEGLIKGEMGQYGLMISEVDGEKAVYEENGAYWAIYENGEYAMQGVDTTKITDGSEYKFEYTK